MNSVSCRSENLSLAPSFTNGICRRETAIRTAFSLGNPRICLASETETNISISFSLPLRLCQRAKKKALDTNSCHGSPTEWMSPDYDLREGRIARRCTFLPGRVGTDRTRVAPMPPRPEGLRLASQAMSQTDEVLIGCSLAPAFAGVPLSVGGLRHPRSQLYPDAPGASRQFGRIRVTQ